MIFDQMNGIYGPDEVETAFYGIYEGVVELYSAIESNDDIKVEMLEFDSMYSGLEFKTDKMLSEELIVLLDKSFTKNARSMLMHSM